MKPWKEELLFLLCLAIMCGCIFLIGEVIF